MGLIVPTRIAVERADRPCAPPWAQDVAETYARLSGRHGKIEWAPAPLNCWYIRLTLRDNDPLRALVQTQATEEQFEDVFLHVPNQHPLSGRVVAGRWIPRYLALDIEQMGAEGLKRFLEEGNTWSGRGKFTSQVDAVRTSRSNHQSAVERKRRDARDNTLDRLMDQRRQMYKIPFHRVGIDFKQPPQDAAAQQETA